MPEPSHHQPAKGTDAIVQDVSAWVLRVGVALSVVVMLIGIIVSFYHETPTVEFMKTFRFDYHPAHIWQGVRTLHGRYIIEVGIYLLVLTPVMRVAMSMILFAVAERDWLYTVVTLAVLALTLTGLLFL